MREKKKERESACACVCVQCVRMREREEGRERERERKEDKWLDCAVNSGAQSMHTVSPLNQGPHEKLAATHQQPEQLLSLTHAYLHNTNTMHTVHKHALVPGM